MTRGHWREPQWVMDQMICRLDLDDACVECGYQFAYDQ